jgi:hypothetical protein
VGEKERSGDRASRSAKFTRVQTSTDNADYPAVTVRRVSGPQSPKDVLFSSKRSSILFDCNLFLCASGLL